MKRTPPGLPILTERPGQGRNDERMGWAACCETWWSGPPGGDQEAFESLVRLSADRLFAIAYRILHDHHLAEDALQQTLVTIWDELPGCAIQTGSRRGATG